MKEDIRDINAQVEELNREVERLKKEARDREWGIQKTNEGIKILYKELEKRNSELHQLDQMKSDFVSTVSHELRTPMTIIKESISQISDGLCGEVSPQQDKLLQMALNNIDRLGRIINNLLDISKLEAGKIVLQQEKLDVVALVREIGEAFEPTLTKKGLKLDFDFSQEHVEVFADRDKITQVFTNLIANAVKFTEAGQITLGVCEKGEQVQCRVVDTGRGIAAEDLEKVFDKFSQFGRKPGSGEKGTGLGLAISKGIVELHDGTIWVESQEGQGTTFTFTLSRGGNHGKEDTDH